MTNNDQPDNLSWGARLCPSCNKNEVIRAEKCRSCWAKAYDKKNAAKKAAYMKQYYAKNRPTYLKKAKDQSVAKKEQTQSVLKTMLGAIMEQDQTIKTMTSLSSLSDLFAILKDGIHIHVHVHQEKDNDERTQAYIRETIERKERMTDICLKAGLAGNTLLYDTATGKQTSALSVADLERGLKDGSLAYGPDKRINIIDSKGMVATCLAPTLKHLLNNGYRLESPSEAAVREYLEEAQKKKVKATVASYEKPETKPTVISQTETCDLPGCTIDHTVSSILKSIKVI